MKTAPPAERKDAEPGCDDRQERFEALNLSFARARRVGLRWEIIINGPDDIDRPVSPINPKFWSRMTAARIASCFNSEVMTAAWMALAPPTERVSSCTAPNADRIK